jgi:hypothetical protein
MTRPPDSTSAAAGVVRLHECSDTLHIVSRGGPVFVGDGAPPFLETDITLLTATVALSASVLIARVALGPK